MQKITISDIKSASWIWPLDTIEAWVKDLSTDPSDIAVGFCSLKRWVTEHVEETEAFEHGLALSDVFLDEVEKWLSADNISDADLRLVFGILMTMIGEFGPYRYETKKDPSREIWNSILGPFEELRIKTVKVAKALFNRPEFDLMRESVEAEIIPLLDRAIEVHGDEHDKYMPFRIIHIGNIAERLLELSIWLSSGEQSDESEHLVNLLQSFYELKYPRFGTSGLRGRWGVDFTEVRARRTAQAICQYLADIDIPGHVIPSAQQLTGKWIVVGYDGRRNSPRVGDWLAETALANGFPVYISSRPTPTPAISYFATHYVGIDNVAAILNCTASHNPSDWQGIKFNPREGYPAPTHLTDIIAARTNELLLLDVDVPAASIEEAEAEEQYKRYDPIANYWNWIKNNGNDNLRIPVNFDQIRDYFKDKLVVIDEMHGAGRGYMGSILGELGIPHKLIHTERDIDLGDLDYANPELPYIKPLMKTVETEGADLGLGMDTDADRFGVVDVGGIYYRPNQVLAMLAYYLGYEQALEGKLVITQTGLPMINAIASKFPNLEKPKPNVIPAYVDHAFYKRRVGEREDMVFDNVFVVPVGIKYIVEIPRLDDEYKLIPEDKLGTHWMDKLILGGEESSGLTTRGHIPDKDGTWANLLIMDMIAYYQKPLAEIWDMVTSLDEGWVSYGGRRDVDASDRAKENLISYYLDEFKGVKSGEKTLAGYPILYAGGVRYDLVEIFLGDETGQMRNFLRIRASGTEPINRVYTETTDPDLWEELLGIVLTKLDEFTIKEIEESYRIERVADILATTGPWDWDNVWQAVEGKLQQEGWTKAALKEALDSKLPHAENRNREVINEWFAYFK